MSREIECYTSNMPANAARMDYKGIVMTNKVRVLLNFIPLLCLLWTLDNKPTLGHPEFRPLALGIIIEGAITTVCLLGIYIYTVTPL